GTLSLAYQVRGTALVRTQCAALAFDRSALTLLSADRKQTADELLGGTPAENTLSVGTFATAAAGWSTDAIPSEYGVCAADDGTSADQKTGILILYASRNTAVTYTDYTTILTVTFRRNPSVPLTESSIRLMTYEEQRAFLQSAKLLLCTADAYATFGSLNGGDTLDDAVFTGNTVITGSRGEDSIVSDEPWVNRFSDVSDDALYYDAVAYVCKNNLFVGSSETTFEPDAPMTRATFATVLCRLAGEETDVLTGPANTDQLFTDVPVDMWYSPYITWAYENGIFIGYGDGRFGPDDRITHEQMYLLIQRFTGDRGYHVKDGSNVSISSVADVDKISDWAYDAVRFAFANGLLIADTNRCIRPTEPAARWELAVLLESLSHIERSATDSATLDTPLSADILNECPPASDSYVRGAFQKIYEGLLSLTERISISMFHLNYEQFITVFHEAAKQPEFFYVGNTFYYSYSEQTGEILSVTPTYTMRGEELVAAQKTYREKLDAILSGVKEEWSDFEKVLYLHDYLATHFLYDETTGQYDTYTFLTTGRGVCQSYTLTYQALLTALGIRNSRVTSSEMNHTWNLVSLGGSWYHVDVTWDDPQPDQYGQAQHTYFLKSDAYMNTHEHRNWSCFDNYTCTNTRYDNAAFTSVRTPFVPYTDGLWYYIDNETGTICSWNTASGKRTQIYKTGMKWVTDEGTYQSLYTGLVLLDDMLLYNTPSAVMAFHISSGVAETVHTNTADGYICGMTLETGTDASGTAIYYAVYLVRATPAEKTGSYYRVQLNKQFTYSLTGVIRGYFTNAQVRITLLRNGAAYKSTTAARSGIYLETELVFSFDGVKPGRYDLLVEKKDCFSYTVKNIDITADTDLRALSDSLAAIPLISGDLSGDGIINDDDCALLLAKQTFHREKKLALTQTADLNGDGFIDIVDYAILTGSDRFGCSKTDCVYTAAA
ncbi:MAG: S-layer homology domain-containing protein, partial [Eubacteriales bacterium]